MKRKLRGILGNLHPAGPVQKEKCIKGTLSVFIKRTLSKKFAYMGPQITKTAAKPDLSHHYIQSYKSPQYPDSPEFLTYFFLTF